VRFRIISVAEAAILLFYIVQKYDLNKRPFFQGLLPYLTSGLKSKELASQVHASAMLLLIVGN
jgi:hypothetical protein